MARTFGFAITVPSGGLPALGRLLDAMIKNLAKF